MHAEAARLVEASYGDVLLKTIGRCYETAADMHLGNPFESAFVAARSKTHAIKTHWRVASQSLKLMSVQQELERQERCAALKELRGYCRSECLVDLYIYALDSSSPAPFRALEHCCGWLPTHAPVAIHTMLELKSNM